MFKFEYRRPIANARWGRKRYVIFPFPQMTIFPHSRLFLGTTKAVVISGPHAQIIDSKCASAVLQNLFLSNLYPPGLAKSCTRLRSSTNPRKT